jgi:O-methyltransferase domain/Dimerisation domain
MNAQATEKTRPLPASSEPLTPESILQLGLGFWASKTLLSAVELGVFTELGHGPLSADDLIARIGLHRRSAHDFLDSLLALGMLERGSGRYANAPAADLFLDRNKQAYVGGMLEMANARLYPFWAGLTDALKTGQPQNEVKRGGDFFAGLYADADRLAGFLKAMTGISVGSATAIVKLFPWAQYRTFADIGTAQGGLASQVALSHPHLRGVGFDLPAVQPHFEEFIGRHGLSDRVSFQAGDFFADPLPSAEVLVMGHVLHDWALDQKKILIEKAYAALPPAGALIVYETIIDDDRRRNVFGLLMSLNMLIETPGGADYTAAECKEWMHQAGFKTTRSEHLVGPESMVVGIK